MFDAGFYRDVLPDRVTRECQGNPLAVPVVNLYLANGTTLDLCHIVDLSEHWLAVQHFRDTQSCSEMDLAFLPYELVTMVAVSLHHQGTRRLGFSLGETTQTGPQTQT